MRFEDMYERVEPQLMAYARGQGGLVTLAQVRKVIMFEFGQDRRTIKSKLEALLSLGKLQIDSEPGQFIVTDYKPKPRKEKGEHDVVPKVEADQ